jgi:hypothetical protein
VAITIRHTITALAAYLALHSGAGCAAELPIHFGIGGFVDLGLVATEDTASWLDAGPGKGRYGGGRSGKDEFKGVIPEAVVLGDLMIGAATTIHLQLKYDDEQRHTVDIGEAFAVYRSAPHPVLRWRLKFGTFLPAMSLENHAIGWTSPYTLSSSALNAWLGEEIRINGADVRARFELAGFDVSVSGAAYLGNDAAGSLIAYRGFAIHDRELALFDDAPIPTFQTQIINPLGPFRMQSDTFEPLHEIDGRVGFYTGIEVKKTPWGLFTLYLYDNNADPAAINRTAGQYAWKTRFITAGYRGEFADQLTVIVQALYGDTVMGPRLPPLNERPSDVDYASAYGLLSKVYKKWRYSGRFDYFETNDRDFMRFNYDNDESGWAATATLMYTPIERVKLALEAQYLDHDRPIRRYTGLPVHIDELSLRANLRFFF